MPGLAVLACGAFRHALSWNPLPRSTSIQMPFATLWRTPKAPDGNSRHNCNKSKNMFAKRDIADDIGLEASSTSINPFRKYSPRDGLRNRDMCGDGGRQFVSKGPSLLGFQQTPHSPTLPRHFNEDSRTIRFRNAIEDVWKAAQEGIQYRMIEPRSHNAWAIGCQSDLLLVMPALGQFAGIVELHQ